MQKLTKQNIKRVRTEPVDKLRNIDKNYRQKA